MRIVFMFSWLASLAVGDMCMFFSHVVHIQQAYYAGVRHRAQTMLALEYLLCTLRTEPLTLLLLLAYFHCLLIIAN